MELTKIWYKNLFKNINIKAEKWLFFISWPSWTWKTTLLKIIAWIIKPQEWKIISDWKIWVFWQDYNLIELDWETNIKLPIFNKNNYDKTWLDKLLKIFWAKKLLNKKIENMSSWEKERIWLVKTFIHKPKIVLIDEAGNSLQKDFQEKIVKFLEDYSKENIVFFISHNINLEWEKIYDWNFKIIKAK